MSSSSCLLRQLSTDMCSHQLVAWLAGAHVDGGSLTRLTLAKAYTSGLALSGMGRAAAAVQNGRVCTKTPKGSWRCVVCRALHWQVPVV